MYFRLGQLVSMALIQGGAEFHVFSSSVFNYLSGMKVNDIIVGENEVADSDIRAVISQVRPSQWSTSLLYHGAKQALSCT